MIAGVEEVTERLTLRSYMPKPTGGLGQSDIFLGQLDGTVYGPADADGYAGPRRAHFPLLQTPNRDSGPVRVLR